MNLEVDIPESIDGSWYQGKIFIGFKDATFEASSPIRHATELYSSLLGRIGSKSMLYLYTDGGLDHHRLTYASVQLALIALFHNLNLDILVAGRTAPHNSWRNPVERMMSIVNLGLQCVGIMRTKGSDEFEQAIKNANNLHQFQESAHNFKVEYNKSIAAPKELSARIMRR